MSARILILTAALATGTSAAAQQPMAASKATVEGCVATAAEIPNQKLDLGQRTGLDQHFVVVDAKVVKGKAPTAPPPSGPGVVSKALAPTYQLHGLTDEQVKLHVGHRVRIEGRFTNLDAAGAAPDASHELIELDVATIRQVPGDCSVPKS